MENHRSSQTAAWVAAARSLGVLLPRDQQLAYDPYGNEFVEGAVRRVSDALLRTPALLRPFLRGQSAFYVFLLWMQLRTRALDDVLHAFLTSGGRQVVLLGAGFDARAVRFAHQLRAARFFEVDHPATQAHKRAVIERAQLRSQARYVAWDFERGTGGLARQLEQAGLASDGRVLTLFEGVTMYLSEQAIEETFALVKSYGAAGSRLAFNYIDQRVLQRAQGDQQITQQLAKLVAREPHRFGFAPVALPGWLQQRGYTLLSDITDKQLAVQHWDAATARGFAAENRHIALAEVAEP